MNDLSVGVPDIAKLTNGLWQYVAMDRTQHLVRHQMTGLAWWVESDLLSDRPDDVLDKLDENVMVAQIAAASRE